MNYIIPDFLKDELFFGDLSTRVDNALSNYNFSLIPQFQNVDMDEISKKFKAYICYRYLLIDSDIEQYVFLKIIKSYEVDYFINPLINQFITINVSSSIRDETIKQYIDESKRLYFKMIRNCMSKRFLELSEKYNDYFKGETSLYMNQNGLNINPNVLNTITKCAIIESKRNPNFGPDFTSVDDAIDYAYNLYYQRSISFKERKEEVEFNKQILNDINIILEKNGFTR